ncbi:MAG: YggS family pyridoxal phosphate-dependent enzyme [Peptococcales bacterium]
MDIVTNLKKIKAEIDASLFRSANPKREVTLIAVTKNRNIEEINQVIQEDHFVLGENRVQELRDKYPLLSPKVKWHLIGHLQRNKVKYITDKVTLVHSLENYGLAEEINKRMEKLNYPMECLVQVNPAQEQTKFGLDVHEVIPFIQQVSQLPWIKIKGLMTIAPEVENPEEVRPVFKEMFKLFNHIKDNIKISNVEMKYLSMGMTNDFQVAIEEGANMVRIGSAIFGPRN